MMADSTEYINAREEYIELIKRELLGPGSEVSIPDAKHELISSSPIQRYSVGILFPRNNKMNSDNNDVETGNGMDGNDEGLMNEAENEEITGVPLESYTGNDDKNVDNAPAPDEGDLDEEVSLAAQNKPSSFGVMFYVNGNTDRIHVSLGYGKYKRATIKDCRVPFRFPENGPHGEGGGFMGTGKCFPHRRGGGRGGDEDGNSPQRIPGGALPGTGLYRFHGDHPKRPE